MSNCSFRSDAEDLARQCMTGGGNYERMQKAARALESWMDSAAMFARNCDFWHGIVQKCADNLGPLKDKAFICDDGSVSQDILGLKIPELVKELADSARRLRPRILVVGNARHGKDTVCEILTNKFGLSFKSSSHFCMELFIFEATKDKYGYADYEACLADCHASKERRAEWFNLISEYNKDDAARLGKAIFNEYSIYCGLRNGREFWEMRKQNVFDYSVWVDRSEHLPPEPTSSMTIEREWCDLEIDNNGTLEDLECNVAEMMDDINTFFR